MLARISGTVDPRTLLEAKDTLDYLTRLISHALTPAQADVFMRVLVKEQSVAAAAVARKCTRKAVYAALTHARVRLNNNPQFRRLARERTGRRSIA